MNVLNIFFIICLFVTNIFSSLTPIAENEDGSGIALFSALSTIVLCGIISGLNFNILIKNKICIVFLALLAFICLSGLQYFASIPLWDTLRGMVFPSNAIFIFLASYSLCKRSEKVSKFFFYSCLGILILNICIFLILAQYNYTMFSRIRQVKETYFFFLGFPFIFCFRNAILKNMGILFFGLLVAISLKRGGIIAYLLSVSVYFFVKNVFIEKRNQALSIVLTPILLILGTIVIYQLLGDKIDLISERFEKIGEDRGSGRMDGWLYAIDLYLKANPLRQLFGLGYYEIRWYRMNIFALHNDFLEFLIDYGLVGFGLIMSISYMFLRRAIELVERNSYYATSFCVMLSIYVVFMNVSVLFFFINYNFLFFAFLGYVYAMSDKEKLNGKLPRPSIPPMYLPRNNQFSYEKIEHHNSRIQF